MKKQKKDKSVKLNERRRSSTQSFGFEDSITKRWNSAKQLQDSFQSSRLRSSHQSPTFTRKVKCEQPNIAEEASSGLSLDGARLKPIDPNNRKSRLLHAEEKVPLLKISPWKSPASVNTDTLDTAATNQTLEPSVNAKYLYYMCNFPYSEKESV